MEATQCVCENYVPSQLIHMEKRWKPLYLPLEAVITAKDLDEKGWMLLFQCHYNGKLILEREINQMAHTEIKDFEKQAAALAADEAILVNNQQGVQKGIESLEYLGYKKMPTPPCHVNQFPCN